MTDLVQVTIDTPIIVAQIGAGETATIVEPDLLHVAVADPGAVAVVEAPEIIAVDVGIPGQMGPQGVQGDPGVLDSTSFNGFAAADTGIVPDLFLVRQAGAWVVASIVQMFRWFGVTVWDENASAWDNNVTHWD
jgi:hypothetical protein